MLNKPPLLSIAIPTYNRSRNLALLLSSLIPQLSGETRVELLISDNASLDDTPVILEMYRHKGLIFRSIRNETNLGADGNIAQCFAEASGKYVWIIGDDDVVLPGALAVILGLLIRDEYDLIYICSKKLDEARQLDAVSDSPKIKIIQDAHTFAMKTHVYMTFISGNIVNKSRVGSLPHQPFPELIGTSLVQLSWTYTALSHLRKGAYVEEPMVAAGADDRGGYGFFSVFGRNFKQITETWLAESALVRIILNGTLQIFLPGAILRSRLGEGDFIEEDPGALLYDVFSDNPRYYFFLYPMLKLPVSLGPTWLLICRIANRLNRTIGYPMLR